MEEDLIGPMHARWFGPPWPKPNWRAPICEDDRLEIPTPVGIRCHLCNEEIVEGENGTAVVAMGMDPAKYPHLMLNGRVYSHRECNLRTIMGCSAALRGEPHDHDGDYRQDALRVEAWLAHATIDEGFS